MKKILLGIIGGFALLIIIVFLCLNLIARVSVEYGAKKITGFPLTIGSVDLKLFSSKVDVRDLKLMNPPEFQEKMFVDMPELYVDYRLGSMISGAPHINDMLINIKQLVIVKNKTDSNVQKLKGVVSPSGGSNTTTKSTKYTLDKLRVHIGTVIIKDYSRTPPSEHSVPMNVDVTYKDITDSTDISRLVLLTVMSQVHLPDLGIDTKELKKNLGDAANEAGTALGGVKDAIGGLFDNSSQQKKK